MARSGRDLTPAMCAERAVRGPGAVVHANQSGYREQQLASHSTSQCYQVNAVVETLAPSPFVLGDVTVEAPGGAGVRGESRQTLAVVRPGKVDAVMAQKHPISVGGVGLTDEVRCRADSELNRTTKQRESTGQLRCERGGDPRIEVHGEQIHVRSAYSCLSGGYRAVEIDRGAGVCSRDRAYCGGQYGFVSTRHAGPRDTRRVPVCAYQVRIRGTGRLTSARSTVTSVASSIVA